MRKRCSAATRGRPARAKARQPKPRGADMNHAPDVVLLNAKVTTLDRTNPEGEAVAIRKGKIAGVGSARGIAAIAVPENPDHRRGRAQGHPRTERQPHPPDPR